MAKKIKTNKRLNKKSEILEAMPKRAQEEKANIKEAVPENTKKELNKNNNHFISSWINPHCIFCRVFFNRI